MTKGIDELAKSATEAEAASEPNRQDMEAAVLSTVARADHTENQDLFTAFDRLAWSRKDFTAIKDAIFDAVIKTGGRAADPFLVKNYLAKDGESVPEDVLEAILDGSKAVEAAVARRYVEILAEQDKRRRALALIPEFEKMVIEGKAEAAFGGLLKGVCNLTESKRLVKVNATEADEIPRFMDALAVRQSSDRAFTGFDSGFKHLNEIFNGIVPGLYVLAGAPSTGKTTLAKQIADNVAELEGVPVLFFSYEQSAEELRIKSLARLAQVDSRKVWKGRTDAEAWAKVEGAAETYKAGTGQSLTIIEADREDSVDAVRTAATIAKHKAEGKRAFIVLDYLQIMPTPEEVHGINGIKDKVDFNLSELRRLSRDLDSPVLVISSQNREAYRMNKPPTMAGLKESGGIEYTADAVLCLWRNKSETDKMETDRQKRCPEDPKTIRVEIHVLKNRNGELAKVKTDFTPAWALFLEGIKEDLSYDSALGE